MSHIIIKSIFYARPHGRVYHLNINCILLNNGRFEFYRYRPISQHMVIALRLIPCTFCAIQKK